MADNEQTPANAPLANGEFPYPYLRCTCEKYPAITYANANMMALLGLDVQSPTWNEFLQDNLFFMIPFEERDYVRSALDSVTESGQPTEIHHHLLTGDGSPIEVTGWVVTRTGHPSNAELLIIYLSRAGKAPSVREPAHNSYLRALESAYGLIFEVDIAKKTVECIHGRETSDIGSIADIRMTLDSARDFWLNNYIVPMDRQMMSDFFDWIFTPGTFDDVQRPLQAEFRLLWNDGVTYTFLCVAVQLDKSTILFCARDVTNTKYRNIEARENVALLRICHHLQGIVNSEKRIKGLIAYSERNDLLQFSYISAAVRKRMNLDDDAYLSFLIDGVSLNDYLDRIGLTAAQHDLLKAGKTCTIDLSNNPEKPQLTYAVSTVKIEDGIPIRDIYLYDSDSTQGGSVPNKGVFARTFGFFDLFVNGTPVTFSSPKEKELMALLIDRNGGTLSTNEAITFLWEDERPDARLKARYRRLAFSLKNTLSHYGISEVIMSERGIRSINTKQLTCDYYEYLAGNPEYRNAFHNTYMSGYSWGEATLGSLWV